MKVLVLVGRKKAEVPLTLPDGATFGDLQTAYAATKKGVHQHRQRFKLGDKALDGADAKLSALGVKDGTTLDFKDLGPQIGYRTVFIWEYAGPIFIVLGYAMMREFFYGAAAVTAAPALHATALLGVKCWVAHFVKREFETVFVHRFSRPTMPLFNLFKNSIYYWSFALLVGYPLCHPAYTAPPESHVQLGFAIFFVAEMLNFAVHVSLRTMRAKEGSKERPIPSGPLFALVSCPNYTFEALGWVGFSLMTHIFWAYAFTLVGFLQMWAWAKKKHRGYLKAYGDEYKKLGRKPIIPFLC